MKVEIKEKETKKEREFPKLMISTHEEEPGMIVLFYSSTNGIVVNPFGCKFIGYHSPNWLIKYFQDFEGSITLSND